MGPPLVAATRDALHRLDPATYAPPLRNAVALRCLRLGRSAFAEASRATANATAESALARARAWMREYQR